MCNCKSQIILQNEFRVIGSSFSLQRFIYKGQLVLDLYNTFIFCDILSYLASLLIKQQYNNILDI